MNKKNILFLGMGFLILLGIAFGTTVLCLKHFSAPQSCGSHGTVTGVMSVHEWTHQLGLSPEQEKKIAPAEATLKNELQAIQGQLAEERIALTQLIQHESADSQKVMEYAQRVSTLEAKQQKLVINHLIMMRDILTVEQRKTLFSSIMHQICEGCRQMVPGHKCICGSCDMEGHSK